MKYAKTALFKPKFLLNSFVFFVIIIGCTLPCSSGEAEYIKLPEPQMEGGIPLMQALKQRQTNRRFSAKELSPQTLSNLLWAAFGINRPDSGKRTAPSAVNWQEIDVYVAMKSGLYVYNATNHALDIVFNKDLREYAGKQSFTQDAPVNLIYVADFSKIRGTAERDFYSAVDTGFISQNVYLFCASEGLNTVVIGSVDKDKLAKKMNLRLDQKIILTQPVGYPQ